MAAIFAHSSSGPVPLRTLTFGVLIVSGGTLAALPFRHYHTIPDSSTTPVPATGPTNSALQMGATSPVSRADFAPPQMTEAILPGSILTTHSENTGVSGSQDRPPFSSERITPLANTKPSHSGPLTYEDLVLPIEMPDIIQQRFNATAAVKSIQMEKERFASSDKSRMEPMTASSSNAPNSANTSLFASQSDNEAVSRSVLQPSVNQSFSKQSVTGPSNGSQQPRMLASGPNRDDATRRMKGGAENRVTRQLPWDAERTLAAKAPTSKETTAGSLASTSGALNISSNRSASANPAESETLPATDSNHLLQSADSPTRPRHWIRQPD